LTKRFGLFFNLRTLFVFASVFAAGYLLSAQQIRANGLISSPRAVAAGEQTEYTPAPDIKLKRLEGGTVNLSDYRGKWVFLNIWATWCSPCVYEMPIMERFYQKFKGQNLAMLAVSVDNANAKQSVIDFVRDKKLTFEIFFDPNNVTLTKFRSRSLPSTYIINPEGFIVSQAKGAREWMDPTVIKYFADLMSIDEKEVL